MSEINKINLNGVDYDIAGTGGGVSDVKVDGTSVVTSGVANVDLTPKLNKLPPLVVPGYSGPYHIPYNADFAVEPDKIKINIETITLDGNLTKVDFLKTLSSASPSNAGLMSATDKAKLDGITPGSGVTDVQVDGVSVLVGGVANIVGKADASDLTAHTDDTDVHTSIGEKVTWNGKQDALSASQMYAVNSGITASKVSNYEAHIIDANRHVSVAQKNAWSNKQDALTSPQLGAVDSGITSSKVTDYDDHIADTDIHVTTANKTAWTAKYDKPATGIPSTDMASAVQTSLGKADTAVQTVATGSTNGTLAVDGTDVAVKGLGTAAYKADTFFVEAETGKRLITTAEGTKLTGIEDGAQVNDIETIKVNGTALGITSKAVDVTIVESSANGKIKVNGSDVAVHGLGTAAYTDATDYATATALTTHTSNVSNPHAVTATQVGLGNVENKSGATIRSEMTAAEVTTALTYTPADNAKVGAVNGIAQLGADGKVPSSQLPAYVDSIIEVNSYGDLPATGASNKIYITKDTNKTYRWGGTNYVEISASLALGETSSTAYAGNKGKIAYDHSQIVGGTGVHVSDAERTAWTAKQNALTTAQVSAVDSGVTATKVSGYDTHVANNDIHVTTAKKDEWDAKYEKDADGIPKSDLHIDVKTSLEKADTSIQEVVTGTGNGTIRVDGSDVAVKGLGTAAYTASTAYATAAQGALADSAYQKPSTGIPKTDLVSAVQTSLGLADTAYQKPATGIPGTDLANAYGDAKNPYASKTARTVLAAPATDGVPTFRALSSADISDIEFITQAEALAILTA